MINNFILQKSDMRTITEDSLISMNPSITKNILDNIIDGISTSTDMATINACTIYAIEKYNTDNGLPFSKRIKYSISVSCPDIKINVLYGYFNNNNKGYVNIIGYDNSNTNFTYNENNKMETSRQGLSTHIIALANIVDIQFGQYSSDIEDKLFNDAAKYTETVYIADLESKLTELYNDLFSLKSTGNIRDLITKFNIYMNLKGYNNADYKKNIPAYNIYIKLWVLYISTLYDIKANYEAYISTGNIDNARFDYNFMMNKKEIIDLGDDPE